MYRKQISQKASPSLRSTPISTEIAPSPSYGSLSSVVQRAQKDPNSVSEDERQQLENAIGTRSTKEILAEKQTPWVPEFQGISAQLWGDAGQVGAPIQAKRKDDVGVSEVQRENKTGLPDNLKAGIENLSGIAMDDVRVHYNSSKPTQLQALAYTQGAEIHVAPGQEEHLPHEAWHVVQQKQGRVKPTIQAKGVRINDDAGLEREADVMGAKASEVTMYKFVASYPSVMQATVQAESVTQLLKVPDAHVRGDLRHSEYKNLFEADTITAIEDEAKAQINRLSNQQLDAAVGKVREQGKMDYKHLSQEKVKSEKQMTTFLQKDPEDEHMYVLNNSQLHVAIRAVTKKLPHPTLVGGDPDVECAGTLRYEEGEVIVTCSSGHFRPPTEGKGKKAVAKMMEKTGKGEFKKPVKGKRR